VEEENESQRKELGTSISGGAAGRPDLDRLKFRNAKPKSIYPHTLLNSPSQQLC
jgi:hypothetical protein